MHTHIHACSQVVTIDIAVQLVCIVLSWQGSYVFIVHNCIGNTYVHVAQEISL